MPLSIKWGVRVRSEVRGTLKAKEDCNRAFIGCRVKFRTNMLGRGRAGEVSGTLKGSISITFHRILIQSM